MPYENMPQSLRPLDLSDQSTTVFGTPIGGESYVDKTRRENEQSQSFSETLGVTGDEQSVSIAEGVVDAATSGANWFVDIAQEIERNVAHPNDPNFNALDYTKQNAEKLGVPVMYQGALARTGSRAEWDALHFDIQQRQEKVQNLQRLGAFGNTTAQVVAGILDIDTAFGGAFSLAGKSALKTTKLGRVIGGASSMTSAATVGALASPEDDYANIAFAAMLGAAMPAVIPGGRAHPMAQEFNERVAKGVDDLDAAVKKQAEDPGILRDEPEVAPFSWTFDQIAEVSESGVVHGAEATEKGAERASRPAATFDPDEVVIVLDEADSSVGAKQVQSDKLAVERPSVDVNTTISESQRYVREHGLAEGAFEQGPASYGGQVAQWSAKIMNGVTTAIGASPLVTDFDRALRSGSATAQKFAHTVLADPTGRFTNRNSAVMIRENLYNRAQDMWHPTYNDGLNSYLNKNGIGLLNLAERNRHTENFNKTVITEIENMRLDGKFSDNIDPDVMRVAQSINETMKFDLATGKRYDVPGYRDTPDSDWYYPRRFTKSTKDHMQRKAKKDGYDISDKMIHQMFSEYYGHMSGLPRADTDKIASMVMARADANVSGMSTRVWDLLSENGDQFVLQQLKINGASEQQAQRILSYLIGKSEERGKSPHMKGRIDGDARFVASNGLKIIDFLDSDVSGVMQQRVRSTSGRAGLAAHGIRTDHDIQHIKDTIAYEQRRNVEVTPDPKTDPAGYAKAVLQKDQHVDEDYLDAMFGYFTGQHKNLESGMAAASRMKRLTTLITMNSLGLTQLMETGPILAHAGLKEFMEQLPAALKEGMANPRSELIDELMPWGVLIPEERLFNPKLAGELDESLQANWEITQYADQLMNMGLKAQPVISGMNKVRRAQQRMAVLTTVDKTWRAITGKAGDAMTKDRLATFGIDKKLIEDLVTVEHHIEWDGNHVKRLNMDKWPEGTADEFSRTMQIVTDQLVQRAHLGEGSYFFSKNGINSLMSQFLSFPLTAIQKQAARNAYIGDNEAMLQLLYGVVTAGTIGMAKNIVAGRYDRLTPEEFVKQGFTQSNLTGWVPIISDPIAHMFNMDSMVFNKYGDVIRTPPALSVLNGAAGLPGTIADLASGDADAIKGLRYLPLIGNWYGTNAILNRL